MAKGAKKKRRMMRRKKREKTGRMKKRHKEKKRRKGQKKTENWARRTQTGGNRGRRENWARRTPGRADTTNPEEQGTTNPEGLGTTNPDGLGTANPEGVPEEGQKEKGLGKKRRKTRQDLVGLRKAVRTNPDGKHKGPRRAGHDESR
jgi:hypothetical protein